MNPYGGVVVVAVAGRLANGRQAAVMAVMVTVVLALRRWMILDVEPQVGLVYFAGASHFVGEFEIHRLHSFDGFGSFQCLLHVRYYNKDDMWSYRDWLLRMEDDLLLNGLDL